MRGGIDLGDPLRRHRFVGVVQVGKDFLVRGWELILPGCGGTSTLARGATFAVGWLHEPQPISNQPVGLGFPHRAGRERPVVLRFHPEVAVVSCRNMEEFLIRG